MTILSLLQKENKTTPKPIPEKFVLTPEQKVIIIKMTAQKIIWAQRVISRAVKRWILKTMKKSNTYIVDIYYEADYDIAENVYLVGEFTNPKWLNQIQMKYSFFHRAFSATVKITQGDQFKFIINGTFV